jgi:hypothetical protein
MWLTCSGCMWLLNWPYQPAHFASILNTVGLHSSQGCCSWCIQASAEYRLWRPPPRRVKQPPDPPAAQLPAPFEPEEVVVHERASAEDHTVRAVIETCCGVRNSGGLAAATPRARHAIVLSACLYVTPLVHTDLLHAAGGGL